MKIEKRDNSVFIAHNGAAIFFNKMANGDYIIRVNKGVYGLVDDPRADLNKPTMWLTMAEITVTKDEFQNLYKLLGEN